MRKILLYCDQKRSERITIIGYMVGIKKVLEGEVLEGLCMSGAAARTGKVSKKAVKIYRNIERYTWVTRNTTKRRSKVSRHYI